MFHKTMDFKQIGDKSKIMTVGSIDMPSQEAGYPEIISQSRDGTSYKSNRIVQHLHK